VSLKLQSDVTAEASHSGSSHSFKGDDSFMWERTDFNTAPKQNPSSDHQNNVTVVSWICVCAANWWKLFKQLFLWILKCFL